MNQTIIHYYIMVSLETKTEWQYEYFGYLIREEWLIAHAVRNDLLPDMTGKDPDKYDEVGSVISAAITDVLAKARLSLSSTLGSVLSYDGKPLLCFVLATNDPLDNLPPNPPPEKWAKLKEVFQTTKEPHWYLALV